MIAISTGSYTELTQRREYGGSVRSLLLVYDRSRGALLREAEFSDTREAMRARFATEDTHRGQDIEVVVLSARSRDDLLQIHGRYFLSMNEFAERFSSSVRAAMA